MASTRLNNSSSDHTIAAVGYCSRQCRSKNHSNEDRFVVEDPISSEHTQARFFAVFDGHGGDRCSEFLRQRMCAKVLASKSFGVDYSQSLVDGILESEQDYRSMILEESNGETATTGSSGSCAITALLVDNELYLANVGDCRAVVSINGQAKALTRDHRASDPHEKERVVKAGGFVRSNRVFGLLAVTRSLGDLEYKVEDTRGTVIATPEIFQEKLTQQHYCILLACDGIWDVVPNNDATDLAVHILSRGGSGLEAAQALVSLAFKRGSKDDLTAVVVPLREPDQSLIAVDSTSVDFDPLEITSGSNIEWIL